MMKKYFSLGSCFLAVIMVMGQGISLAAEIWSEPTYTEPWSQSEYTEPWTEPIYTEPWIETEVTDIWSEPSKYIQLQIGSKNGIIQDKNVELDVPPSVINGRTMVPIRFVAEALNAKVDWDQKTQQVTVSLEGKTISLILGKSTALVNGKQVNLDVPAISKDGRTLVPIRFISENLNLFVNYTASTQTIEISDQPFGGIADSTPKESTKDSEKTPTLGNPIVDFEQLYGNWYIWTPGAVTNLYDKTTGDYVTHDYTQGADQGKVVINKDGTYSMSHDAWAVGKTVEGKWRLSFPAEINGERVQGIVLLNGITNVDWVVAPSSNGKIRLLYSMGRWADGSTSWVFDSELYRK